MVEGFEPESPEKAREKQQEQQKPEVSASNSLRNEAFDQKRDVQRVSDNQTDKPKDPAQVYQTVFAELNAAKQGMKDVVGIIDKGGGPYAKGDGFKAYQQTLDQAQQHYTNARLAADTFLYQCDKQGNPILDGNGKPVPTKENIALQQQRAALEQDMKKLANDQTPEGRAKLAQEMQQSHQIDDLLRSSGYARANNAFALMFHSADLKDPERKNFAKTGVALLGMAATFDGKMWGPPPDQNFMKHYDSAMDAVMSGTRPGDQTQPQKPADQTQPQKPADQTQPQKPADQQRPSDQAQKPADQVPLKDVPGATVGVDGNKFYINYANYHLPTWSKSNPDGSPAQAFKGPDGSLRGDGMLRPVLAPAVGADGKPVVGQDGKPVMAVQGVDGKPIMDQNGQRRLDAQGNLVPTQFDVTDPKTMLDAVDKSIKGPLADADRANYNTVIESADKIDRVSLAKAIEQNNQIIQSSPLGQLSGKVGELSNRMADDFKRLGQYNDLTQPQIDGLKAMWAAVKQPQDLDKWMKDPANKANSDALSASPHWKEISALYTDYLTAETQVKALKPELEKLQADKAQVAKLEALTAMNRELGRIYTSSLDARAGYLAKLLVQDDAKKFLTLQDKNSADAKALAASPNVQEAQRIMLDLAKMNPSSAAQLEMTAKALGLDLKAAAVQKPADQAQPQKPADQTQPQKPADQTQPQQPVDQTQPQKPADQTQPQKPADQTQPQKPADQTQPQKPADQTQAQKPADQTNAKDKVDPTAPAKPAEKLSEEQLQSATTIFQAGQAYAAATDGFTKPIPKEKFDTIAPIWEKAIAANASISPETLNNFEKQTQIAFASRMQYLVAQQKSGKQTPDENDLKTVTVDEVRKAQTDALNVYGKAVDDLAAQLKTLNPENRAKFDAATEKFQASMEQAQKDAGNPPDRAKLKAAYDVAYKAQIDAQKALSPELGKAIDAREAVLNTAAGVYAQQFAEDMNRIDSYRHVDQARVQFAQALALQGKENDAKAAALLTDAMKNPEVAKVLQGTSDGQALLSRLNLATPDMKQAQEDADKLFPEMKLQREAALAFADKSKDPKAAYTEADKLYKQAEEASDKEIMQKGGGKDVADSLAKINQTIAAMEMQLGMALDAYKAGARQLPPGPGGPERDKADDAIVKNLVKDMSHDDMVQALMGAKGPDAKAAMLRILNQPEMLTMNNMMVLSQKAALPALIRMNHALATSEYATKANDKPLQEQAKNILVSIAQVDPQTFNGSPEIVGALKQAEQGRQMDISNGKASAIAFTEAAKDTISKSQVGLVDKLVPNTSLIANNVLNSTAGIYASDLWLVGGMFGGSKESTDKIIEQMAHARQKNEEEALLQRNQVVNDGKSQVRGFLGDATGVATSFGTGWLTNRGLNMLTTSMEKAPLPFWGKALVIVPTALVAGGAANNAVAGNDLLSSKGYIRNTVATGTTYAAIKGLEYLPGRQTLSAETTAKLANRLGYAEGAQVTGMQVARDATAAEAALGKSKIVQIAEAIGPRVNPINYTPFKFVPAEAGKSSWNLISRFRVAGMGGERTAAMFANGTMSLAEYNTRLFAAKAMSTAALGYGFGVANKGAAIYTGEHLDGKKYDTPGAIWTDMNQAGLNTALAASITVPFAGAFVPGFAKDAVGKGVTSMFTRIGVADVPAAASALGTSSLMFAQSGLDSGGRFGESRIFADMYRRSDKRFNELKLQELAQQAAQQGVAPKPEEKK